MDNNNRFGFSDSNEVISNISSTCCVVSNIDTSRFEPRLAALHQLSVNLESVFDSSDSFSDAQLVLPCGRELSVHRCVLSSRSPFFKNIFSSAKNGGGTVRFELKELGEDYEVGYDSVVAVLGYLYSGKVRPFPKDVCVCVDDECPHLACRPVVDFLMEVLYLAFAFQICELLALYQSHVLGIIDKVIADDILVILSVAYICGKTCERLREKCVEIIVKSDVDITTLDKCLPHPIAKQIVDVRIELGLETAEVRDFPGRHVKRIHRALDSDDVELVRMLLNEGHTNLDEAQALHYAVAYCDVKTTIELLDLGEADVNCTNSRGYTVLHVAAMRKVPRLIVSLLTKGARPTDLTLDGRKPLQISKRLTKAVDYYKSTEEGKASSEDRLCVEILEQAERREPLLGEASLSLALAGDDLRMKLLYLENRVALARVLFPMEAKVAMDIAEVDGTSEFTLTSGHPNQLVGTKRTSMDLNETPFIVHEEHHKRMKALSRTVELGKHYFPRCSEVLNKIMDADDLPQLSVIQNGSTEERVVRKQRYMEIQEVLSKAFNEDKVELTKSALSSSSSSTSVTIPSVGRTGKLISRGCF